MRYCIDCKKILSSNRPSRCNSCSAKERNKNPKNHSCYKDGRTFKNNFCISCGVKIYWKSKRCSSCSSKLKKHSEESKKKISLAQTGSKSWRYKDGRSLKKCYCKICNKEISWQSEYNAEGLCKSCSHSRERCYNWQGGKSFEPYPLGWTKTFKEQIRYRDGYKCQVCGKPEVECKNKLHVHHIDYNKNNLFVYNLISLCNSCHAKTNHNKECWKQYFLDYFRSIEYVT